MTQQNIFLRGSKIYLRALERSDLNATYLGWLNNGEVTQYLETGTFPTTMQDLEIFYEAIIGSRNDVIFAIADAKTDRHIGNAKLGPIHWVHRRAMFGIMLGEKEFWGKGVGQEATRLVVNYAFQQLNLHRVGLGVFAEHAAAIRCYEAVGFKVEGTGREELFANGTYKNRVWMGLLRSEYQKQGARPSEG